MRNVQIIFFFLLLSCSFRSTYAQGIFNASIEFDKSFDTKGIRCTYNNGKINDIPIADTLVNNKLYVTGKYYSIYASLKIQYIRKGALSTPTKIFFINSQPAKIIFRKSNDIEAHPLSNYTITNAIEITGSNIKKELMKFSEDNMHEMTIFWNEHNNEINFHANDSINRLFKNKLRQLNDRNLLFIKEHASNYFSFWFFRTQIIQSALIIDKTDFIYFDRLLDFFETTFPYKFRESEEGAHIKKVLSAIIQSSEIKSGSKVSNCVVTDINGRIINLNDFKGKYVLIDFWASWCPPCIREMPFIRNIRESYSTEKLRIIGVSWDTDSTAFNAAVRKNGMNWIQIYGNEIIGHLFGVSAIPAIFLINKDGVIIYNSIEKNDKNILLTLLNDIE